MRIDTYRVFVECENCGHRGDIDIPKGRRLKGIDGARCPHCDCKTLGRVMPTRWDRPEIRRDALTAAAPQGTEAQEGGR